MKAALESTGKHEVESVPTWDFYKLGPGEWEQVLEEYDVLIFSDVEAKIFQLAPDFSDRAKFGSEPLTYPDRVRFTNEETPLKKIDFSDFPPILGYNQKLPRDGFDVLLEVKETGDPLLTVGSCGKGKVMAYMSDPAPHWGCNFVYWEHYNDFWIACMDHLSM